ncbi:dienelactone hydrolase family protein [Thermobifida halotolerans]|uniref:Poly(ethylene terephthalate) hydrolase n=1 Tax=Thermobifida halotolerans TaxID=483545 RepID=A0AA97LXT2_9ACTN|nr:dienelactone hydrolase family protein [Thermobifida halotolerans]UOE19989.1 dienelactone hydrolase family protein [Thermobifida halotolerans]
MSSTSPRQASSALSRLVRVAARTAVAATAVAATVAVASPAQAANPYERGPNPTNSSIEALRGPYSVSEDSVSSLVSGFGGGTIYYPTGTNETFGAVAISPGYTGTQSSISWLGPRLASQGFVVMTIDTNTTLDQPDSRASQLDAALDYMVNRSSSTVRNRIDSSRLAAMGHSMGGGGTLRLAERRPDLQAAIPLTPWHTDKTWGSVRVPTLIIGAENDTIASVRSHSEPFYNSLPGSLDKAYLELDGASHFAPNLSNTTIAKYSISWLKRFVDDDTRYTQFLCPGPSTGLFGEVEEYRSTCPF